jgi:4a-hydroxytetrahydrobiopterin dehydratase
MSGLEKKHCVPCEGGVPSLSKEKINELLSQLHDWHLEKSDAEIVRTFQFKNYHQTIAFVNAIAEIAHQENHHPDLEVHYNRCTVRYSTHAVGGLTENDFICAAKVEKLAPGMN